MDMLRTAKTTPLWWDGVDFGTPTPLLDDRSADVAIVGAGYTGLWTAHYLLEADPSLDIVILEAHRVGYGASGRNGGWCYDGFAADIGRIERLSDLATAQRWAAELRSMVDEVGKSVAALGIDCDFHHGGSIEFLRNGGQVARAAADVEAARRYGWSEDDLHILSSDAAMEIGRAADVAGGLWSAHTASVHPAKLAVGLARSLADRGVSIHEQSAVTEITSSLVTTTRGPAVSAPVVVRATEGYTRSIRHERRTLAPLYSLMLATEPLPDELWSEIGLDDRQTFGDLRHLVIYGQRTADNRIAFGGRGAPYDFGSSIRPDARFSPEAFGPVREALVEVFPQVAEVAITHRWGGVLGVNRAWFPTAGYDPRSGLATAGGYVGSGVAATNLAGRTLADLITGTASPLTEFPWVNRRVRRWEPEPLRWLGINAALAVMKRADRVETKHDRPSRAAETLWRIIS